MTTISLKVPDHLDQLLASESRRRQVSKSALIRDCVEQTLAGKRSKSRSVSCADLVRDLIGAQPGPTDASSNSRHLDEAIQKDSQRGQRRKNARR